MQLDLYPVPFHRLAQELQIRGVVLCYQNSQLPAHTSRFRSLPWKISRTHEAEHPIRGLLFPAPQPQFGAKNSGPDTIHVLLDRKGGGPLTEPPPLFLEG